MSYGSQHTYTAYIIVFKGAPLDLQQYRHTALLFEPLAVNNDDTAVAAADTYYCNAVGGGGGTQAAQGGFVFEDSVNYQPQLEPNFIAQIRVGCLQKPLTPKALAALMAAVPVNNDDYEFNCQTWVQLALERLSTHDYLTHDEYDQGITDMVLETMEATDEPQPFSQM